MLTNEAGEVSGLSRFRENMYYWETWARANNWIVHFPCMVSAFRITCNFQVTSHIQGMFNRTIRMLSKGVKPCYVFDGKPPQLKGGEVSFTCPVVFLLWSALCYVRLLCVVQHCHSSTVKDSTVLLARSFFEQSEEVHLITVTRRLLRGGWYENTHVLPLRALPCCCRDGIVELYIPILTDRSSALWTLFRNTDPTRY